MLKVSRSRSKTPSHSTGPNSRTCNTCGISKDIDRFELSKGYRLRQCRRCRSAGKRKKMNNCPYSYINNLYHGLAYRRKKTHDFSVEREDLHDLYDRQQGRCQYSGITMTHIKDGSGKHLSNISIERVDNSVGYVKENIALVCLACNMMKYTLDLKELLNWCKIIAKHNEDLL